MSEATKPKTLSLEELIVLNDEIASLVRAGIPLDRGLLATGRDMPGRLGTLTTDVAIELGQGASLVDAIESERVALPGAYRAVISAGIRSGRLATALESVAGFLRQLAESRREIAAALIYPLFVVVLAWLVGFGLFMITLPTVRIVLADMSSGASRMAYWIPFATKAWCWAGAVPIVLVVLAMWTWYRSGRSTLVESRESAFLLGWIPWAGAMVRTSRVAAFTEVLALLVENDVPLEQSVVLAAESTGEPQLIRSARNLSECLVAGQPLSAERLGELSIPPTLGWMIASGLRHGALLSALHHAAKTYRRRADRAADTARIFLPVLSTLVIGGLAVAISGLGLFLPYICMLHELTRVW